MFQNVSVRKQRLFRAVTDYENVHASWKKRCGADVTESEQNTRIDADSVITE
jgi:hypothetical protein